MKPAALLPDALAAATPVQPVAYALYCEGVVRLALDPAAVAPLLGLSEKQVRELCRAGSLRARNLHPGSRNGRYLISVGALIEFLDGRDDPVPSAAE